MARRRAPQQAEFVDLDLGAPAHLGGVVGRADGVVHFTAHGLPGERVRARIFSAKGGYRRAEVDEVLDARSPDRVPAVCPYYGRCGGCAWMHARYPAQLALKSAILRDQLARIGGFDDSPVQPMIGAARDLSYRNQVRVSVRRDRTLGFARAMTHAVMTIERCHLVVPAIQERLAALQGHVHQAAHQVVIRHSERTGQTLVGPDLPEVGVETGQSCLEDEILGRRFRIGPHAFFQVHTAPAPRPLPAGILPSGRPAVGDWSQADVLAMLVLDRLEAGSGDVLLDCYSGVGVFAALAAPRVARAIGIEYAASAVADARANCADLPNVEFLQGKAEEVIREVGGGFDVAIVDPARVGCARPVVEALIDSRASRLIYVSCDPATLARDLRLLVDGGFALRDIQPLDMFPQTHHIETVATLDRR